MKKLFSQCIRRISLWSNIKNLRLMLKRGSIACSHLISVISGLFFSELQTFLGSSIRSRTAIHFFLWLTVDHLQPLIRVTYWLTMIDSSRGRECAPEKRLSRNWRFNNRWYTIHAKVRSISCRPSSCVIVISCRWEFFWVPDTNCYRNNQSAAGDPSSAGDNSSSPSPIPIKRSKRNTNIS